MRTATKFPVTCGSEIGSLPPVLVVFSEQILSRYFLLQFLCRNDAVHNGQTVNSSRTENGRATSPVDLHQLVHSVGPRSSEDRLREPVPVFINLILHKSDAYLSFWPSFEHSLFTSRGKKNTLHIDKRLLGGLQYESRAYSGQEEQHFSIRFQGHKACCLALQRKIDEEVR